MSFRWTSQELTKDGQKPWFVPPRRRMGRNVTLHMPEILLEKIWMLARMAC